MVNEERTCDSCAYWDRADPLPWRGCKSPQVHYSYERPAEDRGADLWVEIDEGWGMKTLSTFGCVHWSEIPNADH